MQAWSNPSSAFDSDGDLRVNGRAVEIKGQYLNRAKCPTGEELSLLTKLLGVSNNPAFSNEVKENLKKYVRTGDQKILERLGTVMAMSENDQMSSEVNSLVSDLINNKRIVELKKDVYSGIVQNKPLPEVSKRISEFEGKEVADLQLVAELQTAVSARRKREIISSANRSLQLQGRDIDKVLVEAAPLLGSNRPDEREACIQLVKSAYNAELKNFRNEVQKMIRCHLK